MPKANPNVDPSSVVVQKYVKTSKFARKDQRHRRAATADAASKRERTDLAKLDTPYGKVLQTMPTPYEKKPGVMSTCLIKYICPMALLWLLCQEAQPFCDLLQAHAVVKPDKQWVSPVEGPEAPPGGRLVIYMDGVVPGNVHRPDPARGYTAVYWQLLDMPHWMLRKTEFWFDLCCVPKRLLQKMPGGPSQLAELALRMFGPGSAGDGNWNFFEVAIPLTDCFSLRLDFACWLADADEHYDISMAKGAQATKPCPCCKNVVGRMAPANVPTDKGFVHFTCGDYAKIKMWSPTELRQLFAYLGEEVAAGLSKTARRKLFQNAGFRWDPHNVLCSGLSLRANLPDSIYWDWMHTLVSSGGVAQYEINQVIRRIRRLSPTADLDDSIESFLKRFVVFPKAQSGQILRNLNLKERIADKDTKHIRAFASEVLLLVVGLGLWCQIFLEPKNLMPEECRCLQLLGRILYILRSGPQAVRKIHLLQRLITSHHDLYMRLYPLAAKPKVHYLLHIPGCIYRFGVNLSCFVTERRHKFGKGIAARSFREFQDTILRRSLLETLRVFKEPDAFWPSKLSGKASPLGESQLATLQRAGVLPGGTLNPFEMINHQRSTEASLESVGAMHKNDVFLIQEGAQVLAAIAVEFFILAAGLTRRVVVHCRVMRHEGGTAYNSLATTEAYVSSDQVIAVVPYFQWQPPLFHIVAAADLFG